MTVCHGDAQRMELLGLKEELTELARTERFLQNVGKVWARDGPCGAALTHTGAYAGTSFAAVPGGENICWKQPHAHQSEESLSKFGSVLPLASCAATGQMDLICLCCQRKNSKMYSEILRKKIGNPCIHPFYKYSFRACPVPRTVLGTGAAWSARQEDS